jgi:sugar phosphate isomerase/epimerase
MIKLGVNSVLFDGFDFATAAEHIAKAGYDGLEISAIESQVEHLAPDNWQSQAKELRQIMTDNGLEFLSMEYAVIKDEDRLDRAFQAAAELGIPVVNVGPGGESGVQGSLEERLEVLARCAERAGTHGVTLCVKAHVGQAIDNTKTTLAAMEAIGLESFGIDMDPSHVHRAGENPAEALVPVLSRTRHVHIRDCLGREKGPGTPPLQACGRGDIDLMAYCRVLVEGGYDGPVCLEVIGAKRNGLSLADCSIVAAESYGYLNACLKHLGAR